MSATAEAPPTEEAVPTPEPAEREPGSLFRYSIWLHVGHGAEGCSEVNEGTGENTCGDTGHFHAWCRLPNQFQYRVIQQRAMAEKARKMRLLRDPETTDNLVLEDGVSELRDQGEEARKEIIDEMLQVTWWKDYLEAMQSAQQMADPEWAPEDDGDEGLEPDKLYEHVDDDRNRFAVLLAKPEDERDDDDVKSLRDHLQAYDDELTRRVEALQAPRREALYAVAFETLLDQLRKKRIKTLADNEFTRSFSVNQWLSCTYPSPTGEPHFADLAALEAAPNAVIDGLELAFTDLERTAQGDSGN